VAGVRERFEPPGTGLDPKTWRAMTAPSYAMILSESMIPRITVKKEASPSVSAPEYEKYQSPVSGRGGDSCQESAPAPDSGPDPPGDFLDNSHSHQILLLSGRTGIVLFAEAMWRPHGEVPLCNGR
jgi:hypothetical protein